jgi:8-oxo-dGTP diphosphatase
VEHLYLEHDGKLLLVDTEGNGPMIPQPGREMGETGWLMRLPSPAEVALMGIEWTEKRRNELHWGKNAATVIHGFPHIDWPEDWAWKDSLIGDSAVHPVARESVYRTIHRLVSKVLITKDDGTVVMAKVKRGHFVGAWTLPGGYLDYSEHPEQGALRETLEELGIEIDLDEIAPMISQNIFTDEGINFVSFTYRSSVNSDDMTFKPKQDEIAEVAWLSKEEALDRAVSWFDRKALEDL